MSEFDRRLLNETGAILHKQAVGSFAVSVVDEFLVPMVTVTGAGRTTKFELSKIGFYFSDGDNKFYREADDEQVPVGEINDSAIEAHLETDAKKGDKPKPKSSQPKGLITWTDKCDCKCQPCQDYQEHGNCKASPQCTPEGDEE